MKLEIRSRSPEHLKRLKHLVQRRILFALGRFTQRLVSVRVLLNDVNGPRKGRDKHCKVLVTLRPSSRVIVEDRDADLKTVVNRVLDRVGRAVSRRLDCRLDQRTIAAR